MKPGELWRDEEGTIARSQPAVRALVAHRSPDPARQQGSEAVQQRTAVASASSKRTLHHAQTCKGLWWPEATSPTLGTGNWLAVRTGPRL